MPQYIFVLGHNPGLSAIEIMKVLPLFVKIFQIEFISQEGLIVNLKEKIKSQKILENLGGTIKIAEIFATVNVQQKLISEIKDSIKKILIKKQIKKKLRFGFSLYFPQNWPLRKNWQQPLNQLGITLKQELKAAGQNCRFVVSHQPTLSSVIIQKEKLIDEGADFNIFFTPQKVYLGKTNSYQNFEKYSERDYGRPKRDTLVGMIPVKLAKILINLSQTKKSETILDPFCGSGTILQEAILLGYRNLIGSDQNKQAIANSQNNLNWLINKLNLNPQNFQIKLLALPVEKLSEQISPQTITSIITEPYLGSPYQSHSIAIIRAAEIKKLEDLYWQAFLNFQKVLKKSGKIIMIWPVFNILDTNEQSRNLFLSNLLIKKIINLGFQQEDLTVNLKNFQELSPFLSNRRTLLYYRQEQRVLREIIIFIKNC